MKDGRSNDPQDPMARWRPLYLITVIAALVVLALVALRALRPGNTVRWDETLTGFGLLFLGLAGWLGPRRRPVYVACMALSLACFVTGLVRNVLSAL